MNTNIFQSIPGIDACKKAIFDLDPFWKTLPQDFLRMKLTAYWDGVRNDIKKGRLKRTEDVVLERHLKKIEKYLRKAISPNFTRVINATGVVVHTNMGRSELSEEAREAVMEASRGYSNLELDLATGQRGSRYGLIEDLLCYLSGAESAMVVNNNAAAVLLMLDTFCHGGEVIVSRGELVEIGGSFRIPEVMAKSGAFLREVGATNRTHMDDYKNAITDETVALMRVHTSNYRIIGFHEACDLEELSALAHEKGLLMLEDLGSGSLLHFSDAGLPDEPTVQEAVRQGADIVSFSGDKVLGGPQAGILVGRKDLIERCKHNQLTRALRCDKLCMAALEATLRLYIDPSRARQRIPTLRRIFLSGAELEERAKALKSALSSLEPHCRIDVEPDVSRVGGGAFPQYDLPTWLVSLRPRMCSAQTLKKRLLETKPPLIGRLENDAFCLDVRTLEEADFGQVEAVLREALALKNPVQPGQS
ncbi:MAG: L-seryl-tRNA(Sec) selenium transferase [Desulfovibrio sp.]|nr:L-seryl-tRNA(Sec) selenium transferase [Desulfovibrio sp.]